MSNKSNIVYYFYVIFALLIWSTYSFIIKSLKINPLTLTFVSVFFGTIYLLIYLLIKKVDLKISIKYGFSILILTILFLTNSISFFYAYQFTTIENAIFSHYLAPVFVAVLAPLFLKEKIDYKTIIALILSIIGMILIFFPFGNFILYKKDFIGILLGVFSAICYAILIIVVKFLTTKINMLLIIFYQGVITSIIFFLYLLFKSNIHLDGYNIYIMIIVGFTHNFLAPIIYLKGLKKIPAQHAGLLGYFEVLGALLIGYLIMNENIILKTLIGGLLIVISGVIVIYFHSNNKNEKR